MLKIWNTERPCSFASLPLRLLLRYRPSRSCGSLLTSGMVVTHAGKIKILNNSDAKLPKLTIYLCVQLRNWKRNQSWWERKHQADRPRERRNCFPRKLLESKQDHDHLRCSCSCSYSVCTGCCPFPRRRPCSRFQRGHGLLLVVSLNNNRSVYYHCNFNPLHQLSELTLLIKYIYINMYQMSLGISCIDVVGRYIGRDSNQTVCPGPRVPDRKASRWGRGRQRPTRAL